MSRDGIPELPTVDLDGGDDDARYTYGDTDPDRWRRAGRAIAAVVALAVAFVLGVVVTDARQTSSAEQEVHFVAGAPYRGGLGNPQGQREIRVNIPVYNTGTVPVRIVDLDVRGFEVAGDVGLTAQPDRWTTIRTAVIPDCDFRAGRELRLRVETAGGERGVVVSLQAADTRLATIWGERCDASAVFQSLVPTGVTVVSAGEDSITTTTPLRTSLVEQVLVSSAGSQSGGVRATAEGLPASLQPPGTISLRLVWTVSDCRTARTMTELRAGATIEVPERGVPPTTTTVTLPTSALVEMVRFVEAQCGP